MIGRKEEIKELIDLYDSKEAQFVAIYGRRRVGKTYLVNETFQGKFTFRHAGLSPSNELKVGMLKRWTRFQNRQMQELRLQKNQTFFGSIIAYQHSINMVHTIQN